MSLVLASGSERRLQLLRAGGVEPCVTPADVDERPLPEESPVELVRRLARRKAAAVDGDVVVAADTEVALGGTVLGKPHDTEDARRMLQAESGNVLTVWSGVAVTARGRTASRVVGTLLRFRSLADQDVDAYLATGEPFGVAGAFRIQGRGSALVEARSGCWTNVVGLPTCQTARLLAPLGIDLRPDDCARASWSPPVRSGPQ